MTKAQRRMREIEERRSKTNQKMAELARGEWTDETRAEYDELEASIPDIEREAREAARAVEEEDVEARARGADDPGTVDPEDRERAELRSRAMVGNYFTAALRGRAASGAEAELQQAAGVDGIPIELWQPPAGQQTEQRDVTPAPGTTGINLDVLRPYIFAPSIVDRLGVEMPVVPSGAYATGTITTPATADAVGKGDDVPATAAAFTVETATNKRVGAMLELTLEDIASVGQRNFEGLLRQHTSLGLSDELDNQLLNGDPTVSGQEDDVMGFFAQLDDATAPSATVASFDDFVAAFAGGIDGLWATMMTEIAIVCGVDTYRVSARTFRDIAAADLGAIAFSDYAMKMFYGWWTNKRMPAAVSNVQNAILCRKGRSMMPHPMRTAVCTSWGYVSIDDIFSQAPSGTRRFVLSTLIGSKVILVQPDAYEQVAFRTAV